MDQVLTEQQEDFMRMLLKIGYIMTAENGGVIINGDEFTVEDLKDLAREIGLELPN